MKKRAKKVAIIRYNGKASLPCDYTLKQHQQNKVWTSDTWLNKAILRRTVLWRRFKKIYLKLASALRHHNRTTFQQIDSPGKQ